MTHPQCVIFRGASAMPTHALSNVIAGLNRHLLDEQMRVEHGMADD